MKTINLMAIVIALLFTANLALAQNNNQNQNQLPGGGSNNNPPAPFAGGFLGDDDWCTFALGGGGIYSGVPGSNCQGGRLGIGTTDPLNFILYLL